MAADDATHQPAMREVIEPALFAIALAGGVHEADSPRLPNAIGALRRALQKTRFEGNRHRLGKTDTDKAPGRDRVAAANELDRLARRSDLAVGAMLDPLRGPLRRTRIAHQRLRSAS